MNELDPIFIVGCTGVGKSAVALRLAKNLNGEIVAVDSMQVYRGLDIGTAKPSWQERREVQHHLVDVVDLSENFNAGIYVDLARQAAKEIQGRGRRPVFCGGTGLYLKAYLEGLGKTPAASREVRAELEARALPELLAELKQADVESYEQIDHANKRRIVRALEVIRLTGQPFSAQRAPWIKARDAEKRTKVTFDLGRKDWSAPAVIGLQRAAAELQMRIDKRVEAMFAAGLVEETEKLWGKGLADNRTAAQAIGYRQVLDYFSGKVPKGELMDLVKTRTRRFAKRQITWFKHQAEVKWIPLAGDRYQEVVEQIAETCGIKAEGRRQKAEG